MEHLRTTADPRLVLLFDTFNGFTSESVGLEVLERGKAPGPYDAFRYGDEHLFAKAIKNAGYDNYRIYHGDASKFDFSNVAPIGAVLLDIDLYAPTLDCLNSIWPEIIEGGGIVIDDCLPNTAWDGSFQAVKEFADAENLTPIRVGQKGYLISRSSSLVPCEEV